MNVAYGYESRSRHGDHLPHPIVGSERYRQRAGATFELCGWFLEWLTAVS